MGHENLSFHDTAKQSQVTFSDGFAGIWLPATEEIGTRLTASYQPMLEVLLYPAAAYFTFMTGFYFLHETVPDFMILGAISSLTAVVCLGVRRSMIGKKLSFAGLEARGIILFLLVYAGLVAEQLLRLQPEKLPLFMFLMLVTATASVSIRVAAAVIAICTTTAFALAGTADSNTQLDVLLVALASSLVAFSMTIMTRRAIMKEIRAGVTAEELHQEAVHLANNDLLTELPNRHRFFQALDKRFKMRRGLKSKFALGIVDLDGFKTVNDAFSHSVGDKLLIEVAQRLGSVCGAERICARVAGDEFGFIVDNPGTTEAIHALGERIRAALNEPYTILGIRIAVSASVVFVPDQLTIFTASEMIERANYAMGRAKETKSGVIVYLPELDDDRRKAAAIEHNLRYCDRMAEMDVVFQPQTDLETGRTIGFEVLGRWMNREVGRVSPGVFIPMAERIGLIGELSRLLLTKALAAASDWPDDIKLSFNLSIRDLDSPAAVKNICDVVHASGFPPERIEFEVTESLIMSDPEVVQRSLGVLHAMGSRVSLDDFGTGYANFAHIDQLNINTIKIDRSFVSRLATAESTARILKTMIDMCASLGVDCLIEGVESEAEVNAVRRMGARMVQGYYFSRPIPAKEIPAYLARELAACVSGPAASGQAKQAG